jgi:hypothetical protein
MGGYFSSGIAAQDTPQPFRASDVDGVAAGAQEWQKAAMKLALLLVLSLVVIVAGSLTFTMILLRG